MDPELQSMLAEVRRRLVDLYGPRLSRVVLFGSRARGDASSDSDIDLLVVLRGDVRVAAEAERTAAIASDVAVEHGLLVSFAFITVTAYEQNRTPLLLNVRREGIVL